MKRLLVTGAGGFIGRVVCREAAAHEYLVRAASRSEVPGTEGVSVGDIGPSTDWRGALKGIETVLHLAGRAHRTGSRERGAIEAYRAINVVGSRRLAEHAVELGVRRLIYVSSIKVNGEATRDRPFSDQDAPAPEDAYGRSKLEAEESLQSVADRTGLEVVIVRPVLVVGPGAKGNLRSLLRLVKAGIPLPFGSVSNRRSLIGVGSLAHLLLRAVGTEGIAGRRFVAADTPPLSTPELIRLLAEGLNRPARLYRWSPELLRAVGVTVGRGAEIRRLLGSLEVDAAGAREALGWRPLRSIHDEVRAMAACEPAPRTGAAWSRS